MKNMRKLFAMVLAVMMVMSLATTAFAADGDTYEIYQIFTGDYSNGVLSNVKWGQNGTGTVGAAVDESVLNALTAVNNSSDAAKLAVITDYVNWNSDAHKTGSVTAYTDLADGYYLVRSVEPLKDSNGSEYYTTYVVEVVDGTLTFSPKGNVPTVDKVVDDSDVSIGDTVTYTLTATMPSNIADYATYKVIFHDDLSDGLTYGSISSVKVGNTTLEAGKYSVTHTNGTLTITIADVTEYNVTSSSTVVVTYTATVNSSAAIGTDGNKNEVYLEYSNDPNWDADGNGEPDVPGDPDEEPTGNTPKEDATVYTWDMEVLKYADNDQNKVLEGVKFILLNSDKSKVANVAEGKLVGWVDYTEGMDVTTYELATDANGKISIDGLESGNYLLRETQELPGYNKLTEDVSVTVDNNNDGSYVTYVAEVNNNSGATLPETGGMGTTMFYVLGSIMVLAAVVLLVTKKRMATAE